MNVHSSYSNGIVSQLESWVFTLKALSLLNQLVTEFSWRTQRNVWSFAYDNLSFRSEESKCKAIPEGSHVTEVKDWGKSSLDLGQLTSCQRFG